MANKFYMLNSEVRFLLVVRVAEMVRRNISMILTYRDVMPMLSLSLYPFTSKTVYDQFAGTLTPEFVKTASLEKMHRTLNRIFTRTGYTFGLNNDVAHDLKIVYFFPQESKAAMDVITTILKEKSHHDPVLKMFLSLLKVTENKSQITEQYLFLQTLKQLARLVYLDVTRSFPLEIFHYAFDAAMRYPDVCKISRPEIEEALDIYYANRGESRPSKDLWDGVIAESAFQSESAKPVSPKPFRIRLSRTEGSIQFWDVVAPEEGCYGYSGITTVCWIPKTETSWEERTILTEL